MNFETVVFYMLAALTIFAALRVITARNPVHAVLFLVLAFISSAGIWILLEAEFLAITLVLVYVGAVMVLFLFVVMMLDINLVRLREGFWRWLPFGAALAGLMAFEMIWVLGSSGTSAGKTAIKHAADYSNTKELGRLIYTDYVYPFEIAAVLLLVAMVAAIALTLRRRKDAKSQVISEQIAVKKSDRLRVVAMQSESKESRE
ncbi:MAG: NADH-quinone oxidoreductase subunit J [Gallionella sp.]|nr:MAG: NADH-quinone oxidoreductase subunit J [Gallionella sp.]